MAKSVLSVLQQKVCETGANGSEFCDKCEFLDLAFYCPIYGFELEPAKKFKYWFVDDSKDADDAN